jgi:prevent-host-death family protein
MRTFSVAQAKAQLSALLDAVEAGEEVEITRRGVPVARLTRPASGSAASFDLAGFLADTAAQPFHHTSDAAVLLREMREGARY